MIHSGVQEMDSGRPEPPWPQGKAELVHFRNSNGPGLGTKADSTLTSSPAALQPI